MLRLARRGIADAVGCCALAAGFLASAASAQPAANAPEKFDILAFDVAGVTKLPPDVVEAAVYPYSGPGKSSDDVEKARKALEDAYKAGGYESVLVEIPAQGNETFVEGILQLKVTESAIGKLEVTGSKHHSIRLVQAQIPSLKQGEVPDLRKAQEELAAANRFPDRYITPAIKPGATPGTIDVELKVEDSLPVHASVELNNDHSASTSSLRATGTVRYTDLFKRGHTLAASYLVSPEHPSESQVFSGSYTAPILGTNWTYLGFGYVSNSNVGSLGGTRVLGDGFDLGARMIYRIPTTSLFQSVSFGFDYKDFKENINVPSSDPQIPDAVIETPVRYVPLNVSYSLQYATDIRTLNVTLGLTAGIRGLGADESINRPKRFNSVGNFIRVNLDADYTRSFGHDIIGFWKVNGQLADSPLITNEQFAIGGMSSARGYFQSEAVGDEGIAGSFELRSPSVAPYIAPFIDEWRFFTFVEGGYIRVKSPLPDQTSKFGLVSIGAGTRIQLLRYLTGNLAFGWALRDGPTTDRGDGQANFSVKAEF